VEQRVSLVTLGVTDLARSRRFYEALGWKTGAAPSDDVVFFQAGGTLGRSPTTRTGRSPTTARCASTAERKRAHHRPVRRT